MTGVLSGILNLIGKWNLFEKAGEKGYTAVIPVYRNYKLCRLIDSTEFFVADLILSGLMYMGIWKGLYVSGHPALEKDLADIWVSSETLLSGMDMILGMQAVTGLIAFGAVVAARVIVRIFINMTFISLFTDRKIWKILTILGMLPGLGILSGIAFCQVGCNKNTLYQSKKNMVVRE